MKTQTLHPNDSPILQKIFLLLLMLFALLFLMAPSTVFSQDKGQITSGYLYENPQGEVGGGNPFTIRGDIMRIDAKDGEVPIRLKWRGQSYDVFYKYAPSTTTESVLNGTWSGNWLNHTFGTSGSCRFEFAENANGQVTATGNKGFGTWTGHREGEKVFLHTSGKNNYEYWAVLRIINKQKLEIDYLGYGHQGYRVGKSWTGRAELTR